VGKIINFGRPSPRRPRGPWSGVGFPLALIAILIILIGFVAYSRYSYEPAPKLPEVLSLARPVSESTLSGRASVIDGDTIEIHGKRIRLYGIDAPESEQSCNANGHSYACGRQAAFVLADLIGSSVIECEQKDTDRYGRLVSQCRVGGRDIGAWMVLQGWATAYRYYSMDYVSQESDASLAKRGIWQGSFTSPYEWRKSHPNSRSRYSRRSDDRATAKPKHQQAIYYRSGDVVAGTYSSLADCLAARGREGNVGVCMIK
jgi:endonuclease YncB( thermonuclease family)